MILVFGKTGQVARELQDLIPEAHFASREEADLADPQACGTLVRENAPQAVINAAAYTAVDRAEEEVETAQLVNAASPGAMAQACRDLGIPFIHISTDYVFDGTGSQPRAIHDPIAPLNAYGRTKAEGEEAIRQSGAVHAIIRTSWVFSRHGNNFVKTMLRLSSERASLNIVADQIGGPTPARAIAETCLSALAALQRDPALSGTYHLAGAPDVSWADFARAIFTEAGQEVAVDGIPTSAYPTPATRPLNSRLDTSGLAAIGVERPQWRPALAPIIEDFKAS